MIILPKKSKGLVFSYGSFLDLILEKRNQSYSKRKCEISVGRKKLNLERINYDIKKIVVRIIKVFFKDLKWLTFFVSENLQSEGGFNLHLDNAENSFYPTRSQWFSWIAARRVTEPYEINSAYVSPVVSMANPLKKYKKKKDG